MSDRVVFTAGSLERLLTDALDDTGVFLPKLALRRVIARMAELAESSVVELHVELHRPGPDAESEAPTTNRRVTR
jgi:hypothetical protein